MKNMSILFLAVIMNIMGFLFLFSPVALIMSLCICALFDNIHMFPLGCIPGYVISLIYVVISQGGIRKILNYTLNQLDESRRVKYKE